MPFRGLLRPGQGFKPFKVLKRVGGMTASGRPRAGKLEHVSDFYGIISQASPREVEQWKQAGHPVTHTIVQCGTEGNAIETDVLELEEPGTNCIRRRFLVQSVQNPGELGHFLVYKVEERTDLQ